MAEEESLAALVVQMKVVMAVFGLEGLESGGARGRSAGQVVTRFGDLAAGAGARVLLRLDRGEPHELGDRGVTLGLARQPRAARDLPAVAGGQHEVPPPLGLAAIVAPRIGSGAEDRFDLLVAREPGGEAAQVEQDLAALAVDVRGEEAVAGAVQQLEAGLLGRRASREVVADGDLDRVDRPGAALLRPGEVDDAETLAGGGPALHLGEAGVGLGGVGAGDPAGQELAVLAAQGEVIAVAVDLQGGVDALAQAGDDGLDRALHRGLIAELDAGQADALALEDDLERERVARLLDDTEVHEAGSRGDRRPVRRQAGAPPIYHGHPRRGAHDRGVRRVRDRRPRRHRYEADRTDPRALCEGPRPHRRELVCAQGDVPWDRPAESSIMTKREMTGCRPRPIC
ncbi:hypothetical protein [Nannocystis pusilla]|uniref:hypothetical protein n=1 Tax=Nannocystis pusilla TaxID=889268 RepID=UPI003B762285